MTQFALVEPRILRGSLTGVVGRRYRVPRAGTSRDLPRGAVIARTAITYAHQLSPHAFCSIVMGSRRQQPHSPPLGRF